MSIVKKLKELISKIDNARLTGNQIARKKGVDFGKNCRLLTKNFGSEPWLIRIGDNVTISSGTELITHDGAGCLIRDEKGRRYIYKPILIGSGSFIGRNSILMPGVVVGDNVIVAAGSVVTKSIPSNCVVGGNPARFICTFEEFRQRALVWPSEAQMDNSGGYKTWVDSGLEKTPKPPLEVPLRDQHA